MVGVDAPVASDDRRVNEGADLLLRECGRLRADDVVVIVCDESTRAVATVVEGRARAVSTRVSLVQIPALAMHGQEPPAGVALKMAGATLCLGLTAKSMAHTRARIAAGAAGARYLSLPDYSVALLASPSLRADYRALAVRAQRVAESFTLGSFVRVTAPSGTDITMSIVGRVGNCAPGYVEGPGDLGSPPDIEANVSPIESSARGVVVVDGSIPYPSVGLLDASVTLRVEAGRITDIDGPPVIVAELRSLFASAASDKAFVLAECGVGLNDKAQLSGVMLTDEGAAGTMHFGFGSNATVGGTNEVPFHLDVVFRQPTLLVDGVAILLDGQLHL